MQGRWKVKLLNVHRHSSNGFSLIELMVVVAIVAVLAMVAYPAYSQFILKGNRAAAQSYLMDIAQRQQLFFNDSRTFAADADQLNMTGPERVENNYTVSFAVDPNAPPTFLITATPKSGTPQLSDGLLSIDNTGEKLHGVESW
jgi:type IV pilus assembly protein PilE